MMCKYYKNYGHKRDLCIFYDNIVNSSCEKFWGKMEKDTIEPPYGMIIIEIFLTA